MYQIANLGVSPYDYLALGMTEHFKPLYFVNCVITDKCNSGWIMKEG